MTEHEESLHRMLTEKNDELVKAYQDINNIIESIDTVIHILNKNSVCCKTAEIFLNGYKASLKEHLLWLNTKIV